MKRIILLVFLVPTIALAGWRPAGQPFGGGTGSITITSGTPGSINLTTLGTYDWLYPEAWGASRAGWHSKKSGGWLLASFDYGTTTAASGTDSRAWTNTSTAADDVNVNALAGVTKTLNGYNGTNAANTGFRFRLPSDGTRHQVFWQGTAFNANTVVTAKLSCTGVAQAKTQTFNTIASTGLDYRAIVTWTAPAGCELVVTHLITLCIGGTSCNLYVGPIVAS